MVLTQDPTVCQHGYESTDIREPQDGSNRPMNTHARCAEPPTQSNPRGAQNAPAAAPVPATAHRSSRRTTRHRAG